MKSGETGPKRGSKSVSTRGLKVQRVRFQVPCKELRVTRTMKSWYVAKLVEVEGLCEGTSGVVVDEDPNGNHYRKDCRTPENPPVYPDVSSVTGRSEGEEDRG